MRGLRIPDELATLIRGMHPVLKRRIRTALDTILDDPTAGKALKEELSGLRSYRVGRLRIIYATSSGGVIEIVAIGPRITIYEYTLDLVKRGRT